MSSLMNSKDITNALYTPLQGDEIRLLKFIESPTDSQSRSATLQVYSLAAVKGKYAVLSYVWGSTDNPGQVCLNEQRFAITRNLLEAIPSLQELQAKSHTRLPEDQTDPKEAKEYAGIWIDALSINQNDLHERAAQVQCMRDIYHEAFYTAVWLGPADDSAWQVFSALFRMSELLPKIKDGAFANARIRFSGDDQEFVDLGLPAVQSPVWDAVSKLLYNSYFDRIWPVQEIMVSKESWIHWGPIDFPWEILVAATIFMEETGCALALRKHLPTALVLSKLILRHNKYSLLDLLIRTSDFQSSDPRDKIYALLGISTDTTGAENETQLSFEISYESSVEVVYTKFAQEWICHHNSLEIFQGLKDLDTESTLPSWVPDWSRKADRAALSNRGQIFKASLDSKTNCQFSNNGRHLHIQGNLFDKISAVSSHAWGDMPQRAARDDGPNRFFAMIRQCREWMRMAIKAGPDPTNMSALETWIKTVVGNRIDDQRNDTIQNVAAVVALFYMEDEVQNPWEVSSPQLKKSLFLFWDQMSRCCVDCRFFVTENGRMGIGPRFVQKGDRVSILCGSKSPLILRTNENRPPNMKVIGEAYVHGIMEGEAFRPDELEEILLV